jgi:hypothetical protein
MASAVISVISKTIDVVTKIKSTEGRKQRWAKALFGLYQALGEIDASLSTIASTLGHREVYLDVGPAISADIEIFSLAIGKMSGVMGQETWDLFQLQNQPDKLQAIGIFDEKIVQVLIKAWFSDGGFVEAFNRIGLSYLFDQKLIRMTDAPFDPNSPVHGYAVKVTETDFRLDNDSDVKKLISIISDTRQAVGEARVELKAFISQSFKLEDIM